MQASLARLNAPIVMNELFSMSVIATIVSTAAMTTDEHNNNNKKHENKLILTIREVGKVIHNSKNVAESNGSFTAYHDL